MRDGVLILPIVIHGPDLHGAGAGADEINLGFGNAVDAAAQAKNDFVGEPVGYGARHIRGGRFVILLAQHLRVGGVVGVEEPPVNRQPTTGSGKRAEGHHGGIGRGIGPLRQVDLLGRAGRGLRRHALRDQIEDAGIGQVVIERGVEGGLEGRSLRICADQFEICRSDADAVVAKVGAGVDPVLGAH